MKPFEFPQQTQETLSVLKHRRKSTRQLRATFAFRKTGPSLTPRSRWVCFVEINSSKSQQKQRRELKPGVSVFAPFPPAHPPRMYGSRRVNTSCRCL